MRVVSINVGQVENITVGGQSVPTGIFKRPVNGPAMVHRLNVEGDRQADLTVHGGAYKAVYLYPWENVAYWRDALARSDLGAGTFGENLTVEGLAESDVEVG